MNDCIHSIRDVLHVWKKESEENHLCDASDLALAEILVLIYFGIWYTHTSISLVKFNRKKFPNLFKNIFKQVST